MIYDRLLHLAIESPGDLFVVTATSKYTFHQAAELSRNIASRLQEQNVQELGIYLADGPEILWLLLASDVLGARACVVNGRYPAGEVRALRERFALTWLAAPAGQTDLGDRILCIADIMPAPRDIALASCREDAVYRSQPAARSLVLTTGTTGEPKGAVYKWGDLATQVKLEARYRGTRWLLAYNLSHFAGIQMMLHVLYNGATLVIPPSHEMPVIMHMIRKHDVEYISATATFWRIFLASFRADDIKDLRLRQITIGGEAATNEVLAGLRRLFPEARISHVYAATEVGSCFSVRDGEKGFPISFLGRGDGEVELKIVDGELFVRSRHSMVSYFHETTDRRGNWQATGDMVRLEGDRVVFLGRKSETINVGGVKVHPTEVEEVILELPEVQHVRVYGRPNPVTGWVVVADVVPVESQDSEALKALIRRHCATQLDRYRQPLLIHIVSELPQLHQKLIRRPR